jgi:putative ABC transport system substrate-binding protein
MARPGGTVTGISVLTRELAAKRLQLLTEAKPGISRVAMLFSPTKGALAAIANTRSAAKNLGVTVQEVQVRDPTDFAGAFRVMAQQQAEAIIMVVGPVTSLHRRQLIELAGARRLPTVCWRQELVEVGCLMSYGADRSHMVNRAAGFVAKILRGAKPANLPVEQPARIEIALNLKTAKALGITIPPSILLRATRVTE